MLMAGAVAGQILECVDAKGKKEYAQVCPPGTVKESVRAKSSGTASSPATATPATKSLAEQDAAFRKRAMERQEAEAKGEKLKADAQNSQRACDDSRATLKQLESGQRIVRMDPNTGERIFLEDRDRPAEIARAREAVKSWCK